MDLSFLDVLGPCQCIAAAWPHWHRDSRVVAVSEAEIEACPQCSGRNDLLPHSCYAYGKQATPGTSGTSRARDEGSIDPSFLDALSTPETPPEPMITGCLDADSPYSEPAAPREPFCHVHGEQATFWSLPDGSSVCSRCHPDPRTLMTERAAQEAARAAGVQAPPSLPAGVRLVSWSPKTPPVAISRLSVVTDVGRFVEITLRQLAYALAHDNCAFDPNGNWSVRELVEQLEQVGVKVVVEPKEGGPQSE